MFCTVKMIKNIMALKENKNKLKENTIVFPQTLDKEFYLKFFRLSKKRGFTHVQGFVRFLIANELEKEEIKTNKIKSEFLDNPANH